MSPISTNDADRRVPITDAFLGYLLQSVGIRAGHRLLEIGAGGPSPSLAALVETDAYFAASELAQVDFAERFDFVVWHGETDTRPRLEAALDLLTDDATLIGLWPGPAEWAGDLAAQSGFESRSSPIAAPPGLTCRLWSTRKSSPREPEPAPVERNERLRQEIEHYRAVENVHDLPPIFHFWSERFVRPKLKACGFDSVDDLFLKPILARIDEEPGRLHNVASLGAGNCDLEVRLAERLRQRDLSNVCFHCLELNPHMLERGAALAAEQGLSRQFRFLELDIEAWQPEGGFSACIANHSLHHFEALESIFALVRRALDERGVFLVNDMIGRNGHMRWPEALDQLHLIWNRMPDRYKYNHQLRRFEGQFDNWDCSKEGNEGIRAQDILPLLLENFHFDAFVAFANLIDVFVDRSFGHNFDPDISEDREFILNTAELDERTIDEGLLKPTHMLAVMRTEGEGRPVTYRHWTPEFCVRRPD